jgi:hypothetical protein
MSYRITLCIMSHREDLVTNQPHVSQFARPPLHLQYCAPPVSTRLQASIPSGKLTLAPATGDTLTGTPNYDTFFLERPTNVVSLTLCIMSHRENLVTNQPHVSQFARPPLHLQYFAPP